ncbi:enoyl-CoA hydratase-related protein [Achromobacter mucicolens]|uniref:enoyl-CoA hydratase-related protein n=1 Tax=Achromobacter mucicolens TaxID=1389922 RepID=UPI0020C7436A|nr:enoyl-CoA hydratase-related protein [Achromobacter mucicolens]
MIFALDVGRSQRRELTKTEHQIMYEFCNVSHEDKLCIITINRPALRNALHRPANLELQQAFDDFQNNPDLRVAILTGAGDDAFCAGNDLKYQAAGNDTTYPEAGFGGITARFAMNKPVIAAVNGLAMGGGFEIALACDLIVASENAFFALPEPLVGLAAICGGILRLPQQIPTKQAMGIILTGRRVMAQEAQTLGFVNEVVPRGEALNAARRWADQILKCSPMSVKASKELAYKGIQNSNLEEMYPIQKTFPAVKALYTSRDRTEGAKAFAEKRAPVWTNEQ